MSIIIITLFVFCWLYLFPIKNILKILSMKIKSAWRDRHIDKPRTIKDEILNNLKKK